MPVSTKELDWEWSTVHIDTATNPNPENPPSGYAAVAEARDDQGRRNRRYLSPVLRATRDEAEADGISSGLKRKE
jgi:ribonuclease HI